jgi:alpha-ketoglutarate-dependent taurine dioxygenase
MRTRSPAVIEHPITKEMLFFNQIQLHHPFWLEDQIKEELVNSYGRNQFPRNVYFGDGTVIPDEKLVAVWKVYDQCSVRCAWQRGDVLMVDNMMIAHGRDDFEGVRKIVVAMGDMVSQ